MSVTANSSDTNWNELIVPVAEHLLGQRNHKASKPNDIRFGTYGSVSIKPDTGVFYNHETKTGGGVLDLVVSEKTGGDHRDAFDYLKRNGFDVGDQPRPKPVASKPVNGATDPKS